MSSPKRLLSMDFALFALASHVQRVKLRNSRFHRFGDDCPRIFEAENLAL